jgi:DNA adenine methylase
LGAFNVPIGTKSTVVFPGEDFLEVSAKLKHALLLSADFEDVIEMTNSGDLLFVDPPYTVRHNNNGFVKYNQHLFSWADQERLRDALVRANHRGAKIIATNAAHLSVRELYSQHFKVQTLTRASVISGSSGGRGLYDELLITNFQ